MTGRLPVYDNPCIRDTLDGRWRHATTSRRNDLGRSYSEIARRGDLSRIATCRTPRQKAPPRPASTRIPKPEIKSRCRQRRRRQGCGWQTRDRETLPSRAAEKGGARHPPDVSNATRPGWFQTAAFLLVVFCCPPGSARRPSQQRVRQKNGVGISPCARASEVKLH
jgi:hypothetical protein